jgi:2-dehydropantoate 2-reductase
MNIGIVGAGAIGGFLGARLAAVSHQGRALHQVSALARGDTLGALQQHGWRLNSGGALLQTPVYRASSCAADLGVQDLLIIAVKSQSLPELAPQLAPMIAPHTLIMPAMNGVPWWFAGSCLDAHGKPMSNLQSLDPLGHIAAALPLSQVLACVVHASTWVAEPGWVQHKAGQGLIVGEPWLLDAGAGAGAGIDNAPSALGALGAQARTPPSTRVTARVATVVQTLCDAGFSATGSSTIRADIWYKLWGNLTMNPVSALTGATIEGILGDPLVRQFCSSAMLEAQAIGAALACPIAQSPEERHQITAKLGAFKTSMLQDAEAGRCIELDAIVGAVLELGLRLQLPTTHIGALMGLTRLFATTKRLYPA